MGSRLGMDGREFTTYEVLSTRKPAAPSECASDTWLAPTPCPASDASPWVVHRYGTLQRSNSSINLQGIVLLSPTVEMQRICCGFGTSSLYPTRHPAGAMAGPPRKRLDTPAGPPGTRLETLAGPPGKRLDTLARPSDKRRGTLVGLFAKGQWGGQSLGKAVGTVPGTLANGVPHQGRRRPAAGSRPKPPGQEITASPPLWEPGGRLMGSRLEAAP